MLYLKSLRDAEAVFKALSAPARIQIMELIYENDQLSMNELAERLGMTNSAVSMHVGKLIDSGLVKIRTTSGKHGSMKIVKPCHERMLIDFFPTTSDEHCYCDDIRIGYYTSIIASPTCGIATAKEIIGEFDDPRVFSFPERFDAGILWIGNGYVEYNLPNHLKAGQQVTEIQISFEISSEYPGFNENFPSDIHFSINGIPLGFWISPGDYGDRKGHVSPSWWPDSLNQYGLLKTLIIQQDGTFIDGSHRISDITIADLAIDYNSQIHFRISVPKDTANCGGMTLFGEDFGDHNQPIRFKVFYEEPENG